LALDPLAVVLQPDNDQSVRILGWFRKITMFSSKNYGM
jgi:hypothetical protein